MTILVRKDSDTWVRWLGIATVGVTYTTYNASYADGRVVEVTCDPYVAERPVNGPVILGFYDQGIWSLEEIEAVGGKLAIPFEVPEGKQIVGEASYTEDGLGTVTETFAVEDIPPPPPEPTVEEKVAAMMNAYGLTLAEFRDVLNTAGRGA